MTDQELRNLWMGSPTVRQFEGGHLEPALFARTITSEMALSCSPEDFIAAFATWPKGFYAGAKTLLTELRERYRVGCLSNSNSLHWTSEIESAFDFAYSSHLTGLMKPDSAAFEHVASQQWVRPSEICFFDDSQLNVEAARSVGFQAFHTVGFDELVRVLEREGLINTPSNSRWNGRAKAPRRSPRR